MKRTYAGHCHCGAVQLQVTSEPITSGCSCNCSICIRKGGMWSRYYTSDDVVVSSGREALTSYQFADRDVNHLFCATCGISPFTTITGLPADYTGAARLGDHRINLGCIDDLEHETLALTRIDGKSL